MEGLEDQGKETTSFHHHGPTYLWRSSPEETDSSVFSDGAKDTYNNLHIKRISRGSGGGKSYFAAYLVKTLCYLK